MTQRLGLERTTCKVAAGNTKAEILRAAQEAKADLIVLGSRERHGLAILVNFTEDTDPARRALRRACDSSEVMQ